MSIDPSFRSLPDELKLMVLKHAVRTDIAILKGFVKEAYYGENLMLIARQGNHVQAEEKGIIRYPPPSVASLVRHIRWLTINSKDISLNLQKLALMSRMADGTLGFKNLKSVPININNCKLPDGDRDAFRKQLQALSKIAFPTRLLRIESVIYSDDNATINDFELPLLEMIYLKGDGPREECWQRFHRLHKGKKRSECVSAFPPRSPPERRARLTIKSVSLQVGSSWHAEHKCKDMEIQK